jgi:YVTN family beta-propeller protein
MRTLFVLLALAASLQAQLPRATATGYELPNGWRITPTGRNVVTSDYILNVIPTPDQKQIVALNSGFNPHGLYLIDPKTAEITQRVNLKSAWFGMAWSPDGKKLYVSGGNGMSRVMPGPAPVYVFGFNGQKLSQEPIQKFEHSLPGSQIYWSGIAHHPSKPLLYAANRVNGAVPGHIVVFNTETGQRVARVDVEMTPYDVVLDATGSRLYVANWSSRSVSVIDTASNKVVATVKVGHNPTDMVLAKDGRLYVACSNENSVYVVDTKKLRATEVIHTAMYSQAPVGSTPNAVTLDPTEKMLFVANADNNNVAVVSVAEPGESNVMGFVPVGWYPAALSVSKDGSMLYVGNAKGMGGYSNERGPHSPLVADGKKEGLGSVKSLQKGSVSIIPLGNLKNEIKALTKKAMENMPYSDELLASAKQASAPSILPAQVGTGSPIKHVIYIIRENRTYDQVLGDLPQGNGDPRITIFGKQVTPNGHKIAEEFVLFDNLYCDGEVSVDGHSWSNSAYATDFNEKLWPPNYGGISSSGVAPAYVPSSGHLWDLAARKGLTYRSYGEYATRVSDGSTMEAAPGVAGLVGHVSPKFKSRPGMRDTDNVAVFLEEFDEYEKNYENRDPATRLPNYIVMSLGEDHTQGTRLGVQTPRAMVANNDWAVGQLVDRVSHSKYWNETAIFLIEDDAQDGSDHVDARRTVGYVISPYTKRKHVDSTLYTTSSMIRTIELLLGLPPMTQYDAAATPMFKAFMDKADLTPFDHVKPLIDVNEMNSPRAWGVKESMDMDFTEYDRTPMFALNEIIWKSVKGPDSEMPLPVRRFHFRR